MNITGNIKIHRPFNNLNWIFALLMLTLLCCLTGMSSAAEIKSGGITGKVMISDIEPMANGEISVFNDSTGPPPSSDRYWRIPDKIIKTDKEGKFSVNLAEGTYYIGAILRKSGGTLGPPREGDLFLPFHGESSPRKHLVKSGSITDIGTITGARPFNASTIRTTRGITAIEGKLTDTDGNPVSGALLFAFKTPTMKGKPLFISDRTDKEGRYQLRVDSGGRYYLKARNTYGGGVVKPGEITGFHGLGEPKPVEVTTGSITKDINIIGTRFAGRFPKAK